VCHEEVGGECRHKEQEDQTLAAPLASRLRLGPPGPPRGLSVYLGVELLTRRFTLRLGPLFLAFSLALELLHQASPILLAAQVPTLTVGSSN
jgi:hypothetical protein